MLTKSQQGRIARRFTTVVIHAMDSFPDLLEKCEAEEAAKIVADVIKAHISKAMPEPLPEVPEERDSLAQIVAAIAASEPDAEN